MATRSRFKNLALDQLDEWEAENILEGQRWAAGAAKRRCSSSCAAPADPY